MADQTGAPTAPKPNPPAAPEAPKTPKPVVNRDYSVIVRKKGGLDEIVEFLKENVASDATTEVTVKIGGALANTPKVAMSRLGDHRDLDGDYEVVADGSFTKFPGIKTETKRRVTGI